MSAEVKIVEYIKDKTSLSSREIHEGLRLGISYSTLKRTLTKLVSKNQITFQGKGRGRKYQVSSYYELFQPVDMELYFQKEIDDRDIKENFNFELIKNILTSAVLFTEKELQILNTLQNKFKNNILEMPESLYANEMERLTIDLSWKSSQIEGNTYSLLETERLLKEKETASGKSKNEAVMLLNHKEAIDFIIANPGYLTPMTVSGIEDIHSILIKDLGVERNVRKRRVGISGTNYKPLDNEHQIKEALMEMCVLVNNRKGVFEKALLSLVLISYIQAFNDGNKRTARIISNALLISNEYCPISFRTTNSIEYKKAMLLFYEQNNISSLKEIFIEQFEFAVETYF